MATETLRRKRLQQHEQWDQAWDQLQHEQQVKQQHAQHAHHLSMNAKRALLYTCSSCLTPLIGSRSESCHLISIVIQERTSLSRFSSSTSTCPSLSSSFPSTSCTASCTLSSTNWSPWKACATPPRGVTTPTTSPSPSHWRHQKYRHDVGCNVGTIILTITGMLMEIVNCQIRGQALPDSLYWVKNHRMDIHVPGGYWQESKWPPDQTLCGRWFGGIRLARRGAKKCRWPIENAKLGNARKLNGIYFIDPDDEEFKDIMKNASRKLENRCQQQCFVNFNVPK